MYVTKASITSEKAHVCSSDILLRERNEKSTDY